MNKTHSSRKREIEMHIKVAILQGNIKRSIDLAEQYNISAKRYGELVRQIGDVG